MFLAALSDRGRWGAELLEVAAARGWRTQLFEQAEHVDSAAQYAFCRIPQHPTWKTEHDKKQAMALAKRGVKLIPDAEQIRLYDDKLAQSEWAPLLVFAPRTYVARTITDAFAIAEEIGYPLISKSAAGSASSEVRLIESDQALALEIANAFGAGIAGRYAKQQGYVIFQEFLRGNPYDYRVCAIGRQRMMLRRMNRSETQPFASGSGKCIPITSLDEETERVLAVSDKFFSAAQTSWCGIDLVRDPELDEWRVLEVTLGWTQKAYADCVFFGTTRRGSEIWSVLCDEIEAGTFA